MTLKVIAAGFMALCLSACIGSTGKPEVNDGVQKPDFNKAAKLNVEMGEEYLRQGQVARAKQKFVHALELQPQLPEAHTSMGYFFETVGDFEEAEKHYKQALTYGEGNGRFFNNYGTFLCRQGRYDEADREFNRAMKDKKYIKVSEVYENAGVCALKKPDVSKAREYLEIAIKRDPFNSGASLEMAKIEFEDSNCQKAKMYLEQYKANHKPSARSVWLSYKINKFFDNKDEVASDALKLKNLFPNSVEYTEYLALQSR